VPKYRVLIEAAGLAAEKLGFKKLWVEIENPILHEALNEASKRLGFNLIEAIQNLTASGGVAIILNGRRVDDLNEKLEDLSRVVIIPIHMGG